MPTQSEHVERFIVDREDDGARLDRTVVRRLDALTGCSRTRVQRWIELGRVSVDGEAATKVARRVTHGTEVAVRLPRPRAAKRPPEPEDIPLDVLFEDEWLIAVAKPPGMVMHPTAGYRSGTLVNALLWHARAWPGPAAQPGLLHRLDRDTSGVVLVAKDRPTLTVLARAMNGRRITKDYVAVTRGRMPTPKDRIALALDRDPAQPTRMLARVGVGRESVTLVEEVAVSAGKTAPLSVLRCTLVTGRMHQIRAHLEARGWPIVGDPVYGGGPAPPRGTPAYEAAVRAMSRQALHAQRLRLAHPVSGHALDLVAPVPRDMRALLDAVAWEVRPAALGDSAWPLP
jgi:23S rRNA pseudouridine1911/1915/1917 synthase